MFGKNNKINEKRTYENAIEAIETFFVRITEGTDTYPAILDHLRNNVDTTEKAVEALHYIQDGMRSLIQHVFSFNSNLEQSVRDLEKKTQ